MNKATKYINEIISEVCLDERVDSGVIDLNNLVHREIIAEKLFDLGVDLPSIMEVVNNLAIRDGKYPDRQAYNKEGWLVTFPSPEYKQAAIKKGTHFASDPTHGKGGMNVYYKRKGKQKRMAQQNPSQVEPSSTAQQPTPPPQEPAQQAAPQGNSQPPPSDSQNGNVSKGGGDSGGSSLPKSGGGDSEDTETPQSARDYEAGPKGGDSAKPSGGGNAPSGDQQAAPAAPPPPPAPNFVNISVEFAKSKQWNPTPFGEWRNAMGETTAIVALSGEVVPIKTTDREELKLFAAKKKA
jgi:hypothetical protein